MRNAKDENVQMLKVVALRLGELVDEVVFLGGAVVSLLVRDSPASSIRPTKDVDIIVDVASRMKYHKLEEKLRSLGFVNHVEEKQPLTCRWKIGGVVVDILPIQQSILGFTNPWYAEAWKTAERMALDGSISIRVIKAPYFLATKLVAFCGRGNNDYLGSADIEDIVTVLDGRASLLREIETESKELRDFLATSFASLLRDRRFVEALPGHLLHDSASQQRLPHLLENIKNMSSLDP